MATSTLRPWGTSWCSENKTTQGKHVFVKVFYLSRSYTICLIQWSPALRTPALYGQFRLSRQKAHIFSLKLSRFIRTPVNTVRCRTTDTFLCPESQTLICCQPRFTDTGYLHTVYFHCHNYVIIVDIVPCSNNDNIILYSIWVSRKLKASVQSKVTDFFK